MVGKKWDNVDRIVLRGALSLSGILRGCALGREPFSFLLDLS